MARKFKLWKDPYDCGFDLYKKHTIEINPGVTILVGCNGIGKTTLLQNIKSELKKEKIPVFYFDNLNDGGANARSEMAFRENYELLVGSMTSSEGENIFLNICEIAKKLRKFIETGIPPKKFNPFENIFKDNLNESEKINSNERWLLLDAVDSGFSVDNIVDLKESLFNTIIKYKGDKEVYIIVSANEYEMANGEQCLDVYNGKYVTFKNYDEYKNLILKSKEFKRERNIKKE